MQNNETATKIPQLKYIAALIFKIVTNDFGAFLIPKHALARRCNAPRARARLYYCVIV